jgi:hypothetical protein
MLMMHDHNNGEKGTAMAERITYYAIIPPGNSYDEPAGLARRTMSDEGFHDEALWRDLNWHFSPTIVEWKRAKSTDELVEISEEEAQQLIDRFTKRWSSLP